MKNKTKLYVIVTVVLLVFMIFIFGFFPRKLNKIYSFNLENYSNLILTINKMFYSTVKNRGENITVEISDRQTIMDLFDRFGDYKVVKSLGNKIGTKSGYVEVYRIQIEGFKENINEFIRIDWLDKENILIRFPNEPAKKYNFYPNDIDLKFLNEIINSD